MTLLLGPPSSVTKIIEEKCIYCNSVSTLLVLFSFLKGQANFLRLLDQFSGKVTYNDHGMNEFVPQRTVAYVNQNDLHIGEMTLREETSSFSDIDAYMKVILFC